MVGDVAGTPGRSLYVRLFETERGAIGNWVDAATGEHGDLVDLIRLNQRHGRLADTIDEAERFLSLPPLASDENGQCRSYLRQSPYEQDRPTAARRLFAASKPLTGSLASLHTCGHAASREYPTCQPCAFIRAATTDPMRMMSPEHPALSRH